MEILVVLAVFVMVTAMAMPSMSRAYTGQQLRGAADVIRGRFADARVKAVESGDIYGFFYQPAGTAYFVAPMSQGFSSIRNGVQPTENEYVLENNIVFAVGETVQDARSVGASANVSKDYANMRPILFYPDGTSQDAVIILQSNSSGSMIQIDLRGLTGTSSRTKVLQPDQVRQ